jgi:monooxygenase
MTDDYDILIIGAGLSGIGMASHLAMECPDKRVAILERRRAIGGTWDLFQYPGIRSDSDMFSFGYQFNPWNELKVLADGPSIRRYIADTARKYGVDRKVHFGIRTTDAAWSSTAERWVITAYEEGNEAPRIFTCKYLIPCTGYYNHDEGYQPRFPGQETFKGAFIHPQHWPEQLDYRGKRVIVIGSGATAVTLIPSMADETSHITMLQRSPSYIFSVPAYDKISSALQSILPRRWVYSMARSRNIFLQRQLYKAAKRWPRLTRRWLLANVEKKLGKGAEMQHFSPTYNPWDERLCAVPDGDLFRVIREGKASIVTDHIKTFTETGIVLESGKTLEADIVVSATGLQLQSLGGMKLHVDGQSLQINNLMTYKGVLLQDVPNLAYMFGYINAPWTLKVDMAASYVCRLLKHMLAQEFAVVTAHAPEGEMLEETVMGSLQSGYVQRGTNQLPRQGRHVPWRVLHSVEADRVMLLKDPVYDSALTFTRSMATAKAALKTG